MLRSSDQRPRTELAQPCEPPSCQRAYDESSNLLGDGPLKERWGTKITLRVIHTSDWHLGHELHGFSRAFEHARFLSWLEDVLVCSEADALLVTGDVFDKQNPASDAQKVLYDFVVRIKRRLPTLDVILIAGNHDSAGRLEAPGPILRELGVHVVGLLGRGLDGALDGDRLILPVRNRDGEVAALCAAIPFLRPADLLSPPGDAEVGDPLIWGVEQVYGEAIDLTRRRLGQEQALIVTGHCYMTGCEISDLSERKILGGHQHALPGSLFPADVAYGALGHLHKPQSVGNCGHVRYAGSPLPLAVNEKDYPHQVVLACFEAARCVRIEAIAVPRSVNYWRVPSAGARVPSEIAEELRQLPADTDPGLERRPFLEVVILLEQPAPNLRHDIEQALAGKFVRLVRLQTVYPEKRDAVGATGPALPDLAELQPEQVFRMCYHETYKGEPDAQMLADFHELVDAAHRTDG